MQLSLLSHSDFLEHLSKHKDPLQKLDESINWTQFKPIIEKAFRVERKSNAGRPPFDYVRMLKVIILQSMYNLSDQQTEFQILDRYTFKRFLGITEESEVPDEKTIWLFRERLGEDGMRKLFDKFSRSIEVAGFIAKKGSVIDATFVDVPRQRNSRDENDQIKNGDKPDDWSEPKSRQKDIDARWTKKNDETHFGYKNHVLADVKHKIIRDFAVTSANTHDSQAFAGLLDECARNGSPGVYADSAYSSEAHEQELTKRGLKSRVLRKGNRGGGLCKADQNRNHRLSKTRVRVEHIFAAAAQRGADLIRCIGIRRARSRICLTNLTYNMNRIAALGGCA